MRPYEGIDRAFEIVPEAVVVLKLQAGFRVPTTPAPCIFSIENIRYLYLKVWIGGRRAVRVKEAPAKGRRN
jgi:hypothetical protein